MGEKIFISHGHNDLAKHKLKDFIHDRLQKEPIVLAEQPDLGLMIVEKLEHYRREFHFALILITGDDETVSGGLRARQNVIHELGYFHGVLGRKRVLLLKEVGVELFSNITGLIYKEFPTGSIKSIFEDIRLAIGSDYATQQTSSVPVQSRSA
jgi:predicted nucleotide-binding protein